MMKYTHKSFTGDNGTRCPARRRLTTTTAVLVIILMTLQAQSVPALNVGSGTGLSPSTTSGTAPGSTSTQETSTSTSYETCSEMLIWPLSSSGRQGDETDDDRNVHSHSNGDERFVSSMIEDGGDEDDDDDTAVIEQEPLHFAERAERARVLDGKRERKRLEDENRKKLQITINKILSKIDDLSRGNGGELCTTPSKQSQILPGIPIGTHVYRSLQEKADLIAFFMSYSLAPIVQPSRNSKLPKTQFQDVQRLESDFQSLFDEPAVQNVHFVEYFMTPANSNHTLYERVDGIFKGVTITPDKLTHFLWFFDPNTNAQAHTSPSHNAPAADGGRNHKLYGRFMRSNETLHAQLFGIRGEQPATNFTNLNQRLGIQGYWSWPYYQCIDRVNDNNGDESDKILGKWMISYSVAFPLAVAKGEPFTFSFGILSFDIDLTLRPINQCSFASEAERLADLNTNPLFAFRETNKCNPESTQCNFLQLSPTNGWRKGNYECRCRANHYALDSGWNNTISGYKAESTWCKEISNSFGIAGADTDDTNGNVTASKSKSKRNHSFTFRDIVSCRPCPKECPNCTQGKSCMAQTHGVFRAVLLSISVVCIVATFGLIIAVYKLRKMPILKNSSPVFLCITLVGSIIMYSEMVALFPGLTIASCIAVKWTRHLGFCITYTALYMKLCRVYLTYRVKSAHKIKLTEKHLLHWMSPIMVIMLLYLFAWTISDPPRRQMMTTWNGDKFAQCIYNWWDHALAIGEFIFLIYGVWICWRIRENPDAQLISYSIYNIAVVNTVMVSIHLLIVPKAGPDWKYFFAFIRTQLSTTVTIALVLGSKLYHIMRGDAASKKEIANSANGFGHESLDLAEENQQLKEELQKMATQMERLKSYAMCKNNPHLKQYNSGGGGSIAIPNEKDFGKFDSFTAL